MAYATNDEFSQRSGLGLRQVDETVGTGSGTATAVQSFDLDNNNVVAGTYTLSHAVSGSNVFTDLTETDDYVLDKESGRIYTTGTGAGKLGEDTLYAVYTYIDAFNDTTVTALIDNATDQIDKLTGRKWDTPTSTSEYYDGRRSSTYPMTDRPYMADWDQPDFIVLKKWPVTKIDNVFFLSQPQSINKFFNYDLGTTTYTDKTDEVNSSTETPFTLFNAAPATNDIIYIGSAVAFLGLDVNLSTVGVGASTIDWEYYNGTAWADITETEIDTGSSTFLASGKFTWDYPYGWTQNSVNGTTLYWIRGTLTDNYSTDPVCATMNIQDGVSSILEPRNLLYRDNGILNFSNGVKIPDGQLNVRVDYSYGLATTPGYIKELAILIASVQAYVDLSGGSYDDITSFSLGSKSYTVGEVYVNIREVLTQFKRRIEEILNMIGKRGDISVI